MSDAFLIRDAVPEDAADVVRLIRANAAFHGKLEMAKLTEAGVRRDGFGPHRLFSALLAIVDGRAVGIAQYFIRYYGWSGTKGLFVTDLFVEEESRKLGIGRALLAAAAAKTSEAGCVELALNVERTNVALEFYRRRGMEMHDLTVNCRLKDAALQALVARAKLPAV